MASTNISDGFCLEEKLWTKENVSTSQKIRFHSPEKLLPLLGIKKSEENWFTPNFKHWAHQQKRALNRSLKFVINRKSVSISQSEGFLENVILLDRKATSIRDSIWKKKLKKTVSSSRNKIFFSKYWPRLIAIMVSKKYE